MEALTSVCFRGNATGADCSGAFASSTPLPGIFSSGAFGDGAAFWMTQSSSGGGATPTSAGAVAPTLAPGALTSALDGPDVSPRIAEYWAAAHPSTNSPSNATKSLTRLIGQLLR